MTCDPNSRGSGPDSLVDGGRPGGGNCPAAITDLMPFQDGAQMRLHAAFGKFRGVLVWPSSQLREGRNFASRVCNVRSNLIMQKSTATAQPTTA
jgi:hypothetical protein